MARYQSFRKDGKVSLWLRVGTPDLEAEKGVDILKDWCGVEHYDLDNQELSAIDNSFPRTAVAELIGLLSYSSSFSAPAVEAAARRKVSEAYWALAQYDFAYDPKRARGAVAADVIFLGVFDWNDSEDDELEAS